jgi:hypothetical protein
VRLQRIVVIGKRRNFVSHLCCLLLSNIESSSVALYVVTLHDDTARHDGHNETHIVSRRPSCRLSASWVAVG